jgi:class 3 adenylate cyclase/predicted esterase
MTMQERRLAAIMFTDIVGYTALMGRDEQKAFKILEKNRFLQKPLIEKHGGALLKEIGDAILASFNSVYDAIHCAEEIILATIEESDLSLRIGVHQGEVVFRDGDVYGDGVNIAARIQELAIPNSVFISDSVYEEIKNKTDIRITRLGKIQLKNDSKVREIFAVAKPGLAQPEPSDLKNFISVKEPKEPEKGRIKQSKIRKPFFGQLSNISPRAALIVLFSSMALIFGSLFLVNLRQNTKVNWARQELLPQIKRLSEENKFIEAYNLAYEAEKYIPDDSMLHLLWQNISQKIDLDTDPPDADIYIKPVNYPDSNYIFLGKTPLSDTRIYRDYSIWKIEKPGYHKKTFLASTYELNNRSLKLSKLDSLPPTQIYVPFVGWSYRPFGTLALMKFHEIPELEDFIIDKYEVTNTQYKVFVDSGGYDKEEYWIDLIQQTGNTVNFDKVTEVFADRTGQKGPATWEVGDYPKGKGDFPVSGISYYEAAAYAKFAGKDLPSVYHWMYTATPLLSDYISPYSNFKNATSAQAGSFQGIGFFGTLDMAGNVREWCKNIQSSTGNAFILGGGWSDDPYSYNIIYAQDPMDRSDINGFRCIQYLNHPEKIDALNGDIPMHYRDYSKEKPVDDQIFGMFLRQFNYDKSELNEHVEHLTTSSGDINYEKITVDAAYGNERLSMYLLLPDNVAPPYQTIIWFPSTYPFGLSESRNFVDGFMTDNSFYKNGRAILLPVYKSALERSDRKFLDIFNKVESTAYKDIMIMWVKDVSRCIDYLETRDDIDADKIAYAGVSLGAANGAIIPAVEKRIKLAILNVAGLWHASILPEIDQINYLPRIDIPVLMINGKYDHIFPYESSQKPMYELLGTSPADKKYFVYEHGHHVPMHIVLRETFAWLDTYFGPVDK